MKKIIFYLFTGLCFTTGCKKNNPPLPNNPGQEGYCKIIFWKATEVANPYYFEYAANGKLIKSRIFTNGSYQTPNTTQFEYDAQNRLSISYDSASAKANNEYTTITTYSNYTSSGYPQHSIERTKAHRDYETDYVYNAKNSITQAVIQTYDGKDALYSKDTVDYFYDAKENFLKGVAHVIVNGLRTIVTGIEIEGYDANPNFYKSLGNEFNLHRIANSDPLTASGYFAYYLYMPSANNPLKVYLHNQGANDKGDYLTYSYEYDPATKLPSRISFTNTSGGTTRGPGIATAIYDCK